MCVFVQFSLVFVWLCFSVFYLLYTKAIRLHIRLCHPIQMVSLCKPSLFHSIPLSHSLSSNQISAIMLRINMYARLCVCLSEGKLVNENNGGYKLNDINTKISEQHPTTLFFYAFFFVLSFPFRFCQLVMLRLDRITSIFWYIFSRNYAYNHHNNHIMVIMCTRALSHFAARVAEVDERADVFRNSTKQPQVLKTFALSRSLNQMVFSLASM